MKKKVYVGLFSALLLAGATTVTSFAEETVDEVKTEDVAQEQGNDVKPDLGRITLIGHGINHYDELFGDYHFSVAKPAELQGFKLGEVTLAHYTYDESNPTYIGWVSLNHTVKDGKYDSELYFEVHDNGDSFSFKPTKGNMNVARENYPGEYGPSPFIGGEISNGAPFFETPNGTYSAFIRLVFTNVEQPSEDGEENNANNALVEKNENPTNNNQNQNETTNSQNNANENQTVTKQNEKDFVNNVKKTGDTSEKYADNKKLPQTSQTNTVIPGLVLLAIGSVTAIFAKFKFSTK